MRIIFLFFASCLLISCTPKEPVYHTQTYVFGTLVDITIYGETDQKAQAVSNAIIHQYNTLHKRLHAWKPSEISQINTAFAEGQSITVEPDVAAMLAETKQLSIQSDGRFNPAIGHLIQAWGFQQDEFHAHPIDHEKIQQLVAQQPQMSDITIQGDQVSSRNPDVKLDLGGYAKGYALDQGLAYLKQAEVRNALINIGGNIIALGQRGDRPWRVGIQHPRQPNAIATLSLPSGWAVGTSGDYQRYFELDGQRYCHVIDPSTGYPVKNLQSVTVLIPPSSNAGVLSDVVSKPIFIAQPDARSTVAKTMGVEHLLIIESANSIQVSPKMQKQLDWLDTQAKNLAEVITID